MKLVILDRNYKIYVQKVNDMKTIMLIVLSLFCFSANAQVDINYKMGLLEKNVKNSRSNFEKYKQNLSVSVGNFNEATRVVNELRSLKKQAIQDKKRSESNAATYSSVLNKYNEIIAAEQANMIKEREAVQKLESLIASVKKNTAKRESLVQGYGQEIESIKGEIDVWKQKERDVAAVIDEIGTRESGAIKERLVWQKKKDAYKGEAKKWSAELKGSEKTFSIFKNLRE